jgi:DNA-binding GntR family transcriptional regulator
VDGLDRQIAKPATLSELVYAAIRDALINKTLGPGEAVSEAMLARRLNVSKTPVREALLRLLVLGLVASDGNPRLRVVEPSRESIIRAYEVRGVLEPALAKFAARRANPDQHKQLQDAARQSERSAADGDVEGFRYWDRIFHQAVADSAGNEQLAGLAGNALDLTRVLRARDVPFTRGSLACARQHRAIADAIEKRDEVTAAEVAAAHVQAVLEAVLAAADPSSSSSPEASYSSSSRAEPRIASVTDMSLGRGAAEPPEGLGPTSRTATS